MVLSMGARVIGGEIMRGKKAGVVILWLEA